MKLSSLNLAIHNICTQCAVIVYFFIFSISNSHSAGTQDQLTDSVNNQLRTVNQKGETDDTRAAVAEVLVYKNEAKALEQLNKLLSRYKGTPLEASLLFRKAELFVRQSKTARFFEFSREEKKLTLLPKTVKLSSSISKLNGAVEIYEQIQRKHPDYSDLDLVLFNNAFVRQQLNQEKVAEKIYREIIKKFPESYLIPDTYMSLAEMLYRSRRFQDALAEYEAIKKYPMSRVYTYALYKTGWTKYQLRDVVGAIKELESVIQVSEKNLVGEGGNKISLKTEALTDLVLFYPEAYEAKKAFSYFKNLAGNDAGSYLVSLSRMYESHSRYNEFEIILNDLISGLPQSEQIPMAFKALIDTDLILKNYKSSQNNIIRFEKHCNSYLKNSVVPNEQSCVQVLEQQSLKVSSKWHKDWQSKVAKMKEATATLTKKDSDFLATLADASETSYEVYLRAAKKEEKSVLVRFNFAELLFARKKYREAAEQYYEVSLSVKDPKILHDSSYYSIVSLEAAAGDKWTDSDENKYLSFSKNYIDKNPKGKFLFDILFKRSFIAYEKNRLDEAASGFRKLGWNSAVDQKVAVRSQDLYLDILNIKKDYSEIMKASQELSKMAVSAERKVKLEKMNLESSFAYAVVLSGKGSLKEASQIYENIDKNYPKSNLSDKSLWNVTQIYIQQNKLVLAAEKSLEYYNRFSASENSKKSLEKAIELYEYVGNTKKVADIALLLSKINTKESQKWSKISADFDLMSGNLQRALATYKDLLKNPDSKLRDEIVGKLSRVSNSNTEISTLISKYSDNEGSKRSLLEAQLFFNNKNYSKAFKISSEIVGNKNANLDSQAQARFIQAEILADEFFAQSVKSKVEKIEMVLTLKTEKLDKAQRAYQAAIKYGVAEVSGKAFLKLAKLYSHYVESLKNIQITEDIPQKDRELLLSEVEKIVMPIEEKISDALIQGIDFIKKYPAYDDVAFDLRNEFSRINFKGTRYVKYNLSAPKLALPESN